ncbi:hypothetical protein MRX96_038558 [Rhipicephalus microplus]
MGNSLSVLRHVVVYFDDFLATESTAEDHWKNVSKVRKRLQHAALRLELAKCEFMKYRFEYIGHVITTEGLRLSPRNMESISSTPRAQDTKTLQSFMGLNNFYRKVIPRLSASDVSASYCGRYELKIHCSQVFAKLFGLVDVLRLLHEGHPGEAKMKAVARSQLWWPAIDDDVTAPVQACRTCQENQRLPRRVPIKPWPFPERPWSRIYVDYAGPLRNAYLFLSG